MDSKLQTLLSPYPKIFDEGEQRSAMIFSQMLLLILIVLPIQLSFADPSWIKILLSFWVVSFILFWLNKTHFYNGAKFFFALALIVPPHAMYGSGLDFSFSLKWLAASIVVSSLLLKLNFYIAVWLVNIFTLLLLGINGYTPMNKEWIDELIFLIALFGMMWVFLLRTQNYQQRLTQQNLALNQEVQVRRQTEAQLQRSQESLLEAQNIAQQGSAYWNLSQDEMEWSPGIHQLLGIKKGELANNWKGFKEFLSPEDQTKLLKLIRQLIHGEINEYEIEHAIRRKDGIARIVRNQGRASSDPTTKPKILNFSLQDITETKQAAIKLKQAMENAEKANLAKSVFLANMSHEIRTPMNSILGFSEILKEFPLKEEEARFVDFIHKAGKSLLVLINGVLDLSKIDAGKLNLNPYPFALKPILEETKNLFLHQAEAKGLNMEFSYDERLPPLLVVDGHRLIQVINNLTGNALKFTNKGSIQVSMQALPSANSLRCGLKIEVKDTGRGISSEDLPHIFDPFYQPANQDHNTYGGTGLGLSISDSLIQLIGGALEVKSQLGKGTSFTLTLPELTIGVHHNPKTSLESSSINLKGHILLVDDIAPNRSLIQSMLKGFSLKISTAKNGQEALEQVQNNPPDLILMDMKMPVMDGFEASRKLKANPKTRHIPIIALTASVLEQDRIKILELCDEYISKPVEKKQVIRILKKYLTPAP